MNATAQQMEEALVQAMTDAAGELRPISRLEIELVGRQIRWTIWEGDKRLHTVTDRFDAEAADCFLEITQQLLAMRLEDLLAAQSGEGLHHG